MQESDAAKREYKKRREAAGFERDAVLGLLGGSASDQPGVPGRDVM